MGYRYKYEALLSYRQHIKDEAELKLSLARRELKRLQDMQDDLKKSIKTSREELSNGLSKKIPSYLLHTYSEYISALEGNVVLQSMEIIKSEKLVKERLEDLLEKSKQHKVIERLKEKDIKKWKHQQNLEEQKEISEMSVIRHGKEFL